MGNVVDADAKDEGDGLVAGPAKRPEILAGQVRREWLPRRCPPLAAPRLESHGRADGDELDQLIAPRVELVFEPHTHHTIGP